MNVEPLESRIAPATITFADVDGDFVTLKTSKGTDGELNAIVTLTPTGLGMKIVEIDFSNNSAVFFGTDLTVTAKRTSAGGDGRVNVGYIDASGFNGGTNLNLGNVRIAGDLERIQAGTSSPTVPAVKSLTVQSIGEFNPSSSSADSNLFGGLGKLTVAGNIRNATIKASGTFSKIGSVTIGGSLIGESPNSGQIESDDSIGLVKIGGNLEGGGGANSGVISAPIIKSVAIGGSLIGRSGGRIEGDTLGTVKIGDDLRGGSAPGAGNIQGKTIASLTIGGSVVGGIGSGAGQINASESIGSVKIGGDLLGPMVISSISLDGNGSIFTDRLGSLTIGGSMIAGRELLGMDIITNSGAVRVDGPIGSIFIGGSIIGNSQNRAIISALGSPTSTAATDVAIGSLTVLGRVETADILAGYDTSATPVGINADAQIGRVIVSDWIASNLVAGAQDDASAAINAAFGNGDDRKIADTNDALGVVSRIASILIKRTALGTPENGSDHFGFVAQQIGSFKIGATVFPLAPGAASTADIAGLPVSILGDLRIREVAL